jgi:exonuclease SbcC
MYLMSNKDANIDDFKNRFKSIKSRLEPVIEKFNEKKGQLNAYKNELSDLEDREEQLNEEIVEYNDLAEIFRQLSVDLKSDLKDLVEGLTTKALQSIWQEKNIQFELEFEEKRNQIETNFLIREGDFVSKDILNEHGGGVADVVSFMIRVVVHQFYEPSLPNVFIMDEPFKHVSGDDYLERLAEFIHELSRELDFQFYITSHQQNLLKHSDKTFEVTLDEGKKIDSSTVSVIKEPKNNYQQYIHSVKIENFQSHKNTEIQLNGNVNYISGKSNTGKSSLYRAIIWCLRNQPTGDFFIRQGESDVKVTITVEDQRENKDGLVSVARYRSSSKNEYRIEGIDEPITGFRNDVPDIVEEITGFREAKFSDSLSYPLNKYSQHEPYFLLQETSGNVTDVIGSTTGVHIVDHAVKITNDEKRDLERERKSVKESINENNEKISDLSYVEDNSHIVDSLKQKRKFINDKLKKFINLKNIYKECIKLKSDIGLIDDKLNSLSIDNIDSEPLTKKIDRLSEFKQAKEAITKNNKLLSDINKSLQTIPDNIEEFNIDEVREQLDLYDNITSLKEDIERSKNKLSETESALDDIPSIKVSIDDNKINTLNQLKTLKSNILSLRDKIDSDKQKIENCSSKLETVKNEFDEIADGELCPICEQPIKSEKVVG